MAPSGSAWPSVGGQRRGWTSEASPGTGERVTKRLQDVPGDLAAGRGRDPGGAGRRDGGGWRAFLCTDPSATVADILTAVADRFSLEITFRDCKEGSSGRASS